MAKGGDGYEKRIWREQSHTRFDFLLPNHPYRLFYEQKVEECKVEVASEAAAVAGPSTGESLATATPKKGFFCRVLASLWLMFWGLIWHPEQVLLQVHVAFPSGHGETLSLPQKLNSGWPESSGPEVIQTRVPQIVTEKGHVLTSPEDSLLTTEVQEGARLTVVAQQPKVAATSAAFAIWCCGGDRIVTKIS